MFSLPTLELGIPTYLGLKFYSTIFHSFQCIYCIFYLSQSIWIFDTIMTSLKFHVLVFSHWWTEIQLISEYFLSSNPRIYTTCSFINSKSADYFGLSIYLILSRTEKFYFALSNPYNFHFFFPYYSGMEDSGYPYLVFTLKRKAINNSPVGMMLGVLCTCSVLLLCSSINGFISVPQLQTCAVIHQVLFPTYENNLRFFFSNINVMNYIDFGILKLPTLSWNILQLVLMYYSSYWSLDSIWYYLN